MSNLKFKSIFFVITLMMTCVYLFGSQNMTHAEEIQESQKVTLKIMSLNLRHNVDFWEERFELIADEIAALSPDIIGLQEIMLPANQSQILEEMVASRTGINFEIYEKVKTGIEAMSGEGVGILSRYPILKKGFVDLKHGRPGVIARIDLGNGLIIDMANTHLHNNGGDDVRVPQVEKMLKFIDAKTSEYPVFLTGDMNSTPETEAIKKIIDYGFIDTYLKFHGPEETLNMGATSPITLSKDNPVQNPHNRIDYVFYKDGSDTTIQITIIDSVVCFKAAREDGLLPTDHFGVMTTFEITRGE